MRPWADRVLAPIPIPVGGVPDDVYAIAKQAFSEDELVKLAVAIVLINGWNQLCVGFLSEHEG